MSDDVAAAIERLSEVGSPSGLVNHTRDVFTWATVVFSSSSFASTAIGMALGSSVKIP
jgi:hypothetical protein